MDEIIRRVFKPKETVLMEMDFKSIEIKMRLDPISQCSDKVEIPMRVQVGTHRDSLDRNLMGLTTFHPLKDVWYVSYHSTPPLYLVITDRLVSEVTECKSDKEAAQKVKDAWCEGMKEIK